VTESIVIAVNSAAPSFSLFDTKRERVTLDSFRGQKVVLAFFPAAFTGVCTTEMCTLRDSLSRLNKLGAAVVAISVDAPFTNAAFAQENALSFSVLSDYSRETVRAYGVAHDDFANLPGYTVAKRSVFIVDAEGRVDYAWCAPNPGVEPDYADLEAALG
jgi:glutaredoxin-dependent peroxiredoxin